MILNTNSHDAKPRVRICGNRKVIQMSRCCLIRKTQWQHIQKLKSLKVKELRSKREYTMTETQSSIHLSCFIEAIALTKHKQCATRDELKTLLEKKGYHDDVTSQRDCN